MSTAARYLPGLADSGITTAVAEPVLTQQFGRGWWIGFLVSLALTGVMVVSIVWLLWKGVGVWAESERLLAVSHRLV